jgi:hypothetical protein
MVHNTRLSKPQERRRLRSTGPESRPVAGSSGAASSAAGWPRRRFDEPRAAGDS